MNIPQNLRIKAYKHKHKCNIVMLYAMLNKIPNFIQNNSARKQ